MFFAYMLKEESGWEALCLSLSFLSPHSLLSDLFCPFFFFFSFYYCYLAYYGIPSVNLSSLSRCA